METVTISGYLLLFAPRTRGVRALRRPNCFIVGAPKCGTSVLNYYLDQHPDIFVSRKELHYFGKDLHWTERWQGPRTEAEYLSYFADAGNEKRVCEVAIMYLRSTEAAAEIKAFDPEAKIVIMLRSPVEMLHSLHSELVASDSEDIPDFGQALAAESQRKQGRSIPRRTILLEFLYYSEMVQYAKQVERYFNEFGRCNVLVILFDDLKDDVMATYRQVFEFFGVCRGFIPEEHGVAAVNPNKVLRSRLISRLMGSRAPMIRQLKYRLLPMLGDRARASLVRANFRYTPRPSLDLALEARLKREFAPEVEQLSKLLGRDLTHWSAVTPPAPMAGA